MYSILTEIAPFGSDRRIVGNLLCLVSRNFNCNLVSPAKAYVEYLAALIWVGFKFSKSATASETEPGLMNFLNFELFVGTSVGTSVALLISAFTAGCRKPATERGQRIFECLFLSAIS